MKKATSLNRRRFLKTAAVALAAPYVVRATVLGAEGRRSPSERVACACIGVANRGTDHLVALLGDSDAQVVAVCDVDAKHRETAARKANQRYADELKSPSYNGCEGHHDFREVLARPDVDAVTVATPDHWHAAIAVAAAKAGKDIYCEKPMSLTVADGRAMVTAVRRYGRVFQTGSQRRSQGEVRHMCELVRNGRLGRLKTVTAEIATNNKTCPPTWTPEPPPPELDYDLWIGPAPWEPYTPLRCHYTFRFILDYSGGQMTNWGAHYIDVAQWGLGADDSGPVEIEGVAEWPTEGLFNTALKVEFTCTYANGVKLIGTTGPGCTRFEGTEGWINDGKQAEPKSLLTSAIGPNEIHLYETRKSHMGNFLECVRTRQDPSAPVEAGHRSATVCHLGNIALRLGRKLKWDPAAEQVVGDAEANRMLSRPMRAPWTL
jgi:predicted dehydrogenase